MANIGGSNKLLTMVQTAEYLGVPASTFAHKWREWGLRGYRVGKRVQFRERDLESWLAAHPA